MEPFISSDDLAAYLDEAVDGFELLTQIALDSGCQMVRSYLGQTINLVRGDIETHNGNGREVLLLRQLPVIDVGSVTEDEEELVQDTDYIVEPPTGKIYRRSSDFPLGWSNIGRQNIVVIYDHGWAITEAEVVNEDSGDEPLVSRVPSDIRRVAVQAAARIFRAPTLSIVGSSVGGGAVTSETIGGYSYTTDTTAQAEIDAAIMGGLSLEERAMLDYYQPGA